MMRTISRTAMSRIATLIPGFFLVASAAIFTPRIVLADDGPTKESAMKAEEALGKAMGSNDADGFCRLLDPDWAVVNGIGGFGDEPGMGTAVCAAIKAGEFTRKTYEPDFDHARVRVYGDFATVTYKLALSGVYQHKDFSVKEVETDVFRWEDGAWKCVLTHETNVEGTLVMGPQS